ncbi:hypothetical protein [Streptomyces sp. NPDC054975]
MLKAGHRTLHFNRHNIEITAQPRPNCPRCHGDGGWWLGDAFPEMEACGCWPTGAGSASGSCPCRPGTSRRCEHRRPPAEAQRGAATASAKSRPPRTPLFTRAALLDIDQAAHRAVGVAAVLVATWITLRTDGRR